MINDLFCTFLFEYPTSKASDKSWSFNQSENPHISGGVES